MNSTQTTFAASTYDVSTTHEAYHDELQTWSVFASMVSIIASMFVLSVRHFDQSEETIWIFERVSRIVIGTSLRSIGNIMGKPMIGILCSFQGFLKTFGGLTSFLWILFIVIEMYTKIFCMKIFWIKDSRPREFYFYYADCVIFPMAFLFALVPWLMDGYVPLYAWCWIGSSTDEIELMRIISYYGWILLVFFICVFCYLHMSISNKFKNLDNFDVNMKEQYKFQTNQSLDSIKYYPLLFFICYAAGVIRRLMEFGGIDANDIPKWLAYVHVIFTCLWGLLNAILFFVIRHNRSKNRVKTQLKIEKHKQSSRNNNNNNNNNDNNNNNNNKTSKKENNAEESRGQTQTQSHTHSPVIVTVNNNHNIHHGSICRCSCHDHDHEHGHMAHAHINSNNIPYNYMHHRKMNGRIANGRPIACVPVMMSNNNINISNNNDKNDVDDENDGMIPLVQTKSINVDDIDDDDNEDEDSKDVISPINIRSKPGGYIHLTPNSHSNSTNDSTPHPNQTIKFSYNNNNNNNNNNDRVSPIAINSNKNMSSSAHESDPYTPHASSNMSNVNNNRKNNLHQEWGYVGPLNNNNNNNNINVNNNMNHNLMIWGNEIILDGQLYRKELEWDVSGITPLTVKPSYISNTKSMVSSSITAVRESNASEYTPNNNNNNNNDNNNNNNKGIMIVPLKCGRPSINSSRMNSRDSILAHSSRNLSHSVESRKSVPQAIDENKSVDNLGDNIDKIAFKKSVNNYNPIMGHNHNYNIGMNNGNGNDNDNDNNNDISREFDDNDESMPLTNVAVHGGSQENTSRISID